MQHKSVKKLLSILAGTWLLIYGLMTTPVTSKFLSPLSLGQSTVNTAVVQKINEKFSFAPGWSLRNLARVNTHGLATLAYFDIYANEDGTLDTTGAGYQDLMSDVAQNVFAQAHENGAKVVLTVTQTSNASMSAILSSREAQNTLITQSIEVVKQSGADGVLVDFEYQGTASNSLRNAFSDFMATFSNRLHQEIPQGQMAVAVENGKGSNLFDLAKLKTSVDKVYAMAYNIAVPESQAAALASPQYGYAQSQYWQDLAGSMTTLISQAPSDKLVIEKAWYGNGDEYPLYQAGAMGSPVKKYSTYVLSPHELDRLVAGVPDEAKEAARRNLPYIAKALDEEGILTANIMAYALATIEHETAGTFEPIGEYSGRMSARRLGYEGGTEYFGRGFIQLTHLRNYKFMGERIGMGEKLVRNPDLALQPEISARILAAFFKENGVSDLAGNGDFIDARAPINPDYNAYHIAMLAYKYLPG